MYIMIDSCIIEFAFFNKLLLKVSLNELGVKEFCYKFSLIQNVMLKIMTIYNILYGIGNFVVNFDK